MSGLLKDEAAEHDEMGIHLVELQVVRVKKSIEQIDAEMKTVGDSVATFEQAGAKTKHLELLREHRARLEKWLVQTAATPPVPDTVAPVGPASNGPVSKITAPAQPPEVESTVVITDTDTGTTAPVVTEQAVGDASASLPIEQRVTTWVDKGAIYKKKALVERLLAKWPDIVTDFQHGQKNGLIAAARVPGQHGEYFEKSAIEWAKKKGKWIEREPLPAGFNLMANVPGIKHIRN
jgi:hypothetical protein